MLAVLSWILFVRRDMKLHETLLAVKLFSGRGSVRKDSAAAVIHAAFMESGGVLRIVVGAADDVNLAFLGLALRKAFNDLIRDNSSPAEDTDSMIRWGISIRKLLNRQFRGDIMVAGVPQKLHVEFMSGNPLEMKALEKQVCGFHPIYPMC
jgi:hypothetical protein